MSKEDIKKFLDSKTKPVKFPVTIYLTEEAIDKLDSIVYEFNSSRTAIMEAMINVQLKRDKD